MNQERHDGFGSRKTVPRTELKVDYTDRRTALRLIADFSNHWQLLKKTYGYNSARMKVPYKAGADFYAHLHLIAQPATSDVDASMAPDLQYFEDDGIFRYEIRDRKVTVIAPLNRPELWGKVKDSPTPLLYIDRSMSTRPLCRWQDRIWLDLRAWITTGADRAPVPDQYEEGDGVAISGGQFESKRRKH